MLGNNHRYGRDDERDHKRRRTLSSYSRSPSNSRSESDINHSRNDSFSRGGRGNSNAKGRGAAQPRKGDSKTPMKSSGNTSRQKEVAAKASKVAPKASTSKEESTMVLPPIYRPPRDRVQLPVEVVVIGGKHFYAVQSEFLLLY